jgi:uncharacterized protein (TIGR02453 family)
MSAATAKRPPPSRGEAQSLGAAPSLGAAMEAGDIPPPPFDGFPPSALKFLRALATHNEKSWFEANRAAYEDGVRTPLASLIAAVSMELAASGVKLQSDPRRAMFRLNRDVRFSADKSPYKTHAGAAMTRGGDKMAPGLLYIHIDPEGSFTAAGFFRPDPDVLKPLRDGLISNAAMWGRVKKTLSSHGLELVREDVLRNAPRGFGDVPAALEEDIRLKSWIVRRDLPLARLHSAKLAAEIAEFGREAAPLLKFGWAVLDGDV